MPASDRGAPLGVPVVPEVRMTIRPGLGGAEGGAVDPARTMSSRLGISSSGWSTQASTRVTPSTSASRPVNSWS